MRPVLGAWVVETWSPCPVFFLWGGGEQRGLETEVTPLMSDVPDVRPHGRPRLRAPSLPTSRTGTDGWLPLSSWSVLGRPAAPFSTCSFHLVYLPPSPSLPLSLSLSLWPWRHRYPMALYRPAIAVQALSRLQPDPCVYLADPGQRSPSFSPRRGADTSRWSVWLGWDGLPDGQLTGRSAASQVFNLKVRS